MLILRTMLSKELFHVPATSEFLFPYSDVKSSCALKGTFLPLMCVNYAHKHVPEGGTVPLMQRCGQTERFLQHDIIGTSPWL